MGSKRSQPTTILGNTVVIVVPNQHTLQPDLRLAERGVPAHSQLLPELREFCLALLAGGLPKQPEACLHRSADMCEAEKIARRVSCWPRSFPPSTPRALPASSSTSSVVWGASDFSEAFLRGLWLAPSRGRPPLSRLGTSEISRFPCREQVRACPSSSTPGGRQRPDPLHWAAVQGLPLLGVRRLLHSKDFRGSISRPARSASYASPPGSPPTAQGLAFPGVGFSWGRTYCQHLRFPSALVHLLLSARLPATSPKLGASRQAGEVPGVLGCAVGSSRPRRRASRCPGSHATGARAAQDQDQARGSGSGSGVGGQAPGSRVGVKLKGQAPGSGRTGNRKGHRLHFDQGGLTLAVLVLWSLGGLRLQFG